MQMTEENKVIEYLIDALKVLTIDEDKRTREIVRDMLELKLRMIK